MSDIEVASQEPGDDQPVSAETIIGIEGASVAMRNYMAVQHLWSALRSARRCREREDELVRAGNRNIDIGHRVDAINAVLFAVTFLEAYVNETFSDVADPPVGLVTYRTEGLDESTLARMREFWSGGSIPIERSLSIVQKYQLALVCAGKPPFETGSGPAQAVGALIALRNALVHFMPETLGDSDVHKLEKALKPRIVPNQQELSSPWFPNSALAAGCADWACESAMSMVGEWQQRLGLTCDYRTVLQNFGPP